MRIDGHPTGRMRTRSHELMIVIRATACREGLICHNRPSRQRGRPRGHRRQRGRPRGPPPQIHSRHLQASISIVMPHTTLPLGNAPLLSIVIARHQDVAYQNVSQRKGTEYVFLTMFGNIK